MKKLGIIVVIVVLLLILGYVLRGHLPFSSSPGPSSELTSEQEIQGDTQVKIRALIMETDEPIPDLEIDLATQPGIPLVGGVVTTDENGIAEFSVQPDTYYVYFNSSNFPENLIMPEPEKVIVKEGDLNERDILFLTK